MESAGDVGGERIARHGIATRPCQDVATAAALTAAIQAQDGMASRLGIRARAPGVTEVDVVRAIDQERSVVRTWLMRATIHLVAAEDLRWMTALLGPMIRRRFGRTRWLEFGMTPGVLARAEELAPQVLAGGPLPRRELGAALVERGVRVDIDGQGATHLAMYLSIIGMVCRGPDLGGQSTFALIEDWLPDASDGPRGDDALAELARRYFRAFSPATPADFTTWAGLPSARAVQLIRDELTPVSIDDRAGYRLCSVEPARGLRLLSAFDNYLIGYRDRSLIIEPDRREDVYVGGIIRPTVLLDGRVIGRWCLSRKPASAAVEVTLYDAPNGPVRDQIEREVHDIGLFLALPTSVAITGW